MRHPPGKSAQGFPPSRIVPLPSCDRCNPDSIIQTPSCCLRLVRLFLITDILGPYYLPRNVRAMKLAGWTYLVFKLKRQCILSLGCSSGETTLFRFDVRGKLQGVKWYSFVSLLHSYATRASILKAARASRGRYTFSTNSQDLAVPCVIYYG